MLSLRRRCLNGAPSAQRAGQLMVMCARTSTVLWACLLLSLLAAAGAQENGTRASDWQALSRLWTDLQPKTQGSILASWNVTETDPCLGSWGGVICSCDDLPRPTLAAECRSLVDSSDPERKVLGLDFGPISSAGQRKLSGTISTALGDLTDLMYLDLSNNELTGTFPNIAGLSNLQWLLLGGNQFSGPLPQQLGALPNLQQAQLQNNNFSGPVPPSWCGNTATYHVAYNPYLCGALPNCLQSRVNDIDGTYLGVTLLTAKGVCDDTPPDCDANAGCVIWTPMYWTSRSMVSFNFTGFLDYDSTVVRYQWGIGSKAYQADVVPVMDLKENKALKDIRYVGGTQKMMVHLAVHNLSTISLIEGQSYYVTVVAWNGAGPSLSVNTSSQPVLVDTTGPTAGTMYNTLTYQQASSTTATNSLQASWDSFSDAQSGVTGYIVQFFQQTRLTNGTLTFKQLTDPLAVQPDVTRLQVTTSTLPEGAMYIARVTATNGAGLTTTAQTMAITVAKAGDGNVTAGGAALIGVMCSIGCLAIGAALAVYVMKQRVRQHKKREKRRAEDAKQLKALMYALSSQGDMPTAHSGSVSVPQPRKVGDVSGQEVAFVHTDIESSTELSQSDGEAFKQVQEVHDQLMREGIAKHGGYEITTEGDSFQVAFASCHAAMAFCLDIQYRLLEQTWPKQVLALNPCKVIRDGTGQALFAGPRVRMGLHWACEGTVAMRLHNLTRHKVFAGPAVQIVMDVSEAANGGQILLTEDAVAKLTEDMSQAGFPVIRLMGMFQLPSVPSPVFLFGVTEIVGKPLNRKFPEGLRKIKQVWPAPSTSLPSILEFNISAPPMLNENDSLVFVCLRLCTYPKKQKCSLPGDMATKLMEVFATSAQQFKGYMFQVSEKAFQEGIWTVAFQNSMDALRFSHAAQMLLMYVHWPSNAREYCGAEIPSPDGRWLFMGPRVCMAIHQSADFFVSKDPNVNPEAPRQAMRFAGPAITLPLVLTYAGRGGQVILSEQAWDSVKPVITQHPGAVSIISLGMHVVSDDFPAPMLLMEVMPNLLARRVFNRIMTKRLVEPGFRDAPNPNEPMAIVFVKVAKPEDVVAAEKGSSADDAAEGQLNETIQAYQLSVGKYTSLARKLLRRYNGYECKEPEPGKFTLAFKDLADAIRWACHVQEEIMYLDWPEELLRMKGCSQEYDAEGQLIWRGLRIRIGMSWGMISNQKPLNTGRADYFGMLPNGAARVMALATPGQVLVEAMSPPLDEEGQLLLQQDAPTFLKLQYEPGSHQHRGLHYAAAEATRMAKSEEPLPNGRMLVIHAVGYYLLRGLDNPRLLYSAETFHLQKRPLPIAQDMWAPPVGVFGGGGGINSSFASSRDSFRQNWRSWVNHTRTGSTWLSKRLSPRNSTSPTSSADMFAASFGAARKGTGRSQSPTAAASGGSGLFSHAGTGGGGAFLEGPTGAVRSRSSLSVSTPPAAGSHHSSFARGPRGATSETGRVAGLYPAAAVGADGSSSPRRTSRVGSFGRPGSPPQSLRSSQSETATAGSYSNRGGFAAVLAARAAGPILIDAAGQSEDESSGTPAAVAAAAAASFRTSQQGTQPSYRTGNAPWLLNSAGGAGNAVAGQGSLGPAARDLQGQDGPVGAAAGCVSGQEQGPGLIDPYLGHVDLPPIHTTVAPDALWTGHPGEASGGSRDCSESPFSVLQDSSPGNSPPAALPVARSNSGVAKPSQQQPHQQLQEQQRRRSQQMLERNSAGGVCSSPTCPAVALPSGSGGGACLQPWEQQVESWHERQYEQQWQQGGGVSANGGMMCTTPCSLSTTMTSCMDVDEMSVMSAQAQQQQAVANMEKLLSGNADSEASASLSRAATGFKSMLTSRASNTRLPRLSGTSGGFGLPSLMEGFRQAMRRHSTGSSYPNTGSMSRAPTLGHAASGDVSEDGESVRPEVEAVQQQHGMIPHLASPSSSMSHTPRSSAPGSRGGTGGGADLMSPNNARFAADVAKTYSTARQRERSRTSMAGPALYGSQGGLGLDGSFGGVGRYGSYSSSSTAAAAGAANTAAADGSFVASSGLSKGSFSRGGSYTYAESSYSPKHCRPSGDGLVQWPPMAQQYALLPQDNRSSSSSTSQQQQQEQHLQQEQQQQQQQQQQQYEETAPPERPFDQRMLKEFSLKVPSGSRTDVVIDAVVAAADPAVDAADVIAELSMQQASDINGTAHRSQGSMQQQQRRAIIQQEVQQQQGSSQAEANWDFSRQSQQDEVAERLSMSMWQSEDGRRKSANMQEALALPQQSLAQQKYYGQQDAEQLQLQEDRQLYQLDHGLSALQQQQQQQQPYAGVVACESMLELMMHRPDMPGLAVQLGATGGPAFTAQPNPSGRPSVLGAADPRHIYAAHSADEAAAGAAAARTADPQQQHMHQQQQHTHSRRLSPRSALEEQVQQARMSGEHVYGADEYRNLVLQQQRREPNRSTGHSSAAAQQQQQGLSDAPLMSLRQPQGMGLGQQQQAGQAMLQAPGTPQRASIQQQPQQDSRFVPAGRPSPLGKNAKGLQPGGGAANAVATGPDLDSGDRDMYAGAVPQQQQQQQQLSQQQDLKALASRAAGGAPLSQNAAALLQSFQQQQQGPQQMQAAGTGALDGPSSSPVKRAAVLLQPSSLSSSPTPAELPPTSSRGSSGNNSPRLARAGSAQGVPVLQSLHSAVSSAQCSPRSSMASTPRGTSMQRASLPVSSFGAAAVLPPGSPVASSGVGGPAAGSPFLQLQRAGSSSSMGSPRLGCMSPQMLLNQQQGIPPAPWAGSTGGGLGDRSSGEGACGSCGPCDSDDTDDDGEGGSAGVFLGHSPVPPGCRARIPSCSLPAPKEALIAIPELPGFERPSDTGNETRP